MQLSDDEQVRHYLELSYGGAALQDSWTLSDLTVTSGSAIRCLIKVLKHQNTSKICCCVGIYSNNKRIASISDTLMFLLSAHRSCHSDIGVIGEIYVSFI